MNHRQRLLAALRGEVPDRVPWFPRMQLWYASLRKRGVLPERFAGSSLYDVYRALGVGINGHGAIHREVFEGVDIVIEDENGRPLEMPEPSDDVTGGEEIMPSFNWRGGGGSSTTVHRYITPVGEASITYFQSDQMRAHAMMPYQVKHLFQEREHYRVLEYLFTHCRLEPEFESYRAMQDTIGDDGAAIAYIAYSPIQRIVLHLMGFERGFFEMVDHPEEFEHLHELLWEHQWKLLELACQSPAEVLDLAENITGDIISPKIFRRYHLPYYQKAAEYAHARDKILVVHGDGEMKPLLEPLGESGVDACESFTPAPMTAATVEDALAAWGRRMRVWGGVPSSIMCHDFDDDTFEAYVNNLLDCTVGQGVPIVLSVGDNFMPEGDLARLEKVTELIEKRGVYL